eukprot:CAMPEP_0170604056 /NCGR_PEP_ID=MMETSP0224-20130122/19226_1 /TAXON_ID=285029 /ORGANISM="Togula jolla, Strain CCCM 725" /LENGTH=87 /DNA_ID=CAMNT_0010928947 /DNA_START=221 /DNA_END=484 /DNA_ORIENTATION=+
MAFAGVSVGLLSSLGVVGRPEGACASGNGYSACQVWQDCRSLLSFFMGGLVCCLITRRQEAEAEAQESGNLPSGDSARQLQLFASLF